MISKRGIAMRGERERMELVVQARIHVVRLAVAMIAQDVLEGRERGRIEFIAALDRPLRAFAGVGVEQLDGTFRKFRSDGAFRIMRCRQCANETPSPPVTTVCTSRRRVHRMLMTVSD